MTESGRQKAEFPLEPRERMLSSFRWLLAFSGIGPAFFLPVPLGLITFDEIHPGWAGISLLIHGVLWAITGAIYLWARRLPEGAGIRGVSLAGVLACYTMSIHGMTSWGIDGVPMQVLVPAIAVFTRIMLDPRDARLMVGLLIALFLGFTAVVVLQLPIWAFVFRDGYSPPVLPLYHRMFSVIFVLGITIFAYYWTGRLIRSVTAEQARSRDLVTTMRTVFDASPDAIFVLDRNGLIIDTNAAALRLAGATRRPELVGMSMLRLVAPDQQPKVWDPVHHCPRIMNRFERFQFGPPGDVPAQVEIQIVSLNAADPETGFLATIRDRRDEEKLRSQLQKAQRLDSLGALAGGVAHDLNNALNPILGFANLELDTPGLPDETRQSFELIRDCASRATSLSKQLLSLSRGGAPEVRWINATEISLNLISVLDRATPPGVSVTFDGPERHIEVEFSASQYEQVLLNLLTNGVEAIGDKGLLRLELSLIEGDRLREELIGWESDSALLIEVTDSGCGIPADQVPRIFDPFFTTKESRRGTGLGLSVVDRIVTDRRGLVRVESQPGVGSVFRVYLPGARLAEPKSGPVQAAAPDTASRRLSILAVDDEPSNLMLIQKIAEKLGDRVRTANSCSETRAYAATMGENFDLVLMDLLLPDGNGAELYAEIKHSIGNPRVIFLSGYSREAIPKHVLESAEFEAFFPKPINVGHLTEMIHQCRDRRPRS